MVLIRKHMRFSWSMQRKSRHSHMGGAVFRGVQTVTGGADRAVPGKYGDGNLSMQTPADQWPISERPIVEDVLRLIKGGECQTHCQSGNQ